MAIFCKSMLNLNKSCQIPRLIQGTNQFQGVIPWDNHPTPLTRAPHEGQGPSLTQSRRILDLVDPFRSHYPVLTVKF